MTTRPLGTELSRDDDMGFGPYAATPNSAENDFAELHGDIELAALERAALLDIQQWESCPFIAGRIRREEANT